MDWVLRTRANGVS